jgi:ribonuclease HI
MPDGTFTCSSCGASFTVSEAALAKYPGWTPKTCMACKKADGAGKGGTSASKGARPAAGAAKGARSFTRGGAPRIEENLTPAEVLAKYDGGPATGVFTDGSASPNPGPGGWGCVYVVEGAIVAERNGYDPDTTNNRMELTALNLAVQTINDWADGWAARGWTRKTGPIQNLDLVKALYARAKARPELRLKWIKAHDGARWNEYADSLATAWMRTRR